MSQARLSRHEIPFISEQALDTKRPPLLSMGELPEGISFRSCQEVTGVDAYGYHFQYQINHVVVSAVILSDYDRDEDAKEDQVTSEFLKASMDQDDDLADREARFRRTDDIEEEIQAWIEAECRQIFVDILHTTRDQKTESATLYDDLHPEIIYLQPKTVDGQLTVIRYENNPPWPQYIELGHPFLIEADLSSLASSKLPTYLSSQVRMVTRIGLPLVRIEGEEEMLRCKLNMSEDSLIYEHNIYLQIEKFTIQGVPRFVGYVKDRPDGGVIGLLLEGINVRYSTLEGAVRVPGYAERDMGETQDLGLAISEKTIITRAKADMDPTNHRYREKATSARHRVGRC